MISFLMTWLLTALVLTFVVNYDLKRINEEFSTIFIPAIMISSLVLTVIAELIFYLIGW